MAVKWKLKWQAISWSTRSQYGAGRHNVCLTQKIIYDSDMIGLWIISAACWISTGLGAVLDHSVDCSGCGGLLIAVMLMIYYFLWKCVSTLQRDIVRWWWLRLDSLNATTVKTLDLWHFVFETLSFFFLKLSLNNFAKTKPSERGRNKVV